MQPDTQHQIEHSSESKFSFPKTFDIWGEAGTQHSLFSAKLLCLFHSLKKNLSSAYQVLLCRVSWDNGEYVWSSYWISIANFFWYKSVCEHSFPDCYRYWKIFQKGKARHIHTKNWFYGYQKLIHWNYILRIFQVPGKSHGDQTCWHPRPMFTVFYML